MTSSIGSLAALANSPLAAAIAVVVIVLVVTMLVIAVVHLDRRIRTLGAPVFDRTVREAQQQAEWVLVNARQQALDIRQKAEADAEALSASRTAEEDAFRAAQREHLEKLAATAQDLVKQQSTMITQLTQHIGDDLSKKGEVTGQAVLEEAEALKKLFAEEHEKLSTGFAAVVTEAERQMQQEIGKQLSEAKQAADAYRAQKMALINEEIVALVEETARVALGKTLSLDDQRATIIAALEEARAQGVFGKPS